MSYDAYSYKQIFRTTESQNWFRSVAALVIARDALQDFVCGELKRFKRCILNKSPTRCTTCTTGIVVSDYAQDTLQDNHNSKDSRHFQYDNRQPCETHAVFQKCIRDEHITNNPSWTNTEAEEWTTNIWSIATCYMPPKRYVSRPTSKEIGIVDITHVIINCSIFHNIVTSSVKDLQLCQKQIDGMVKKIRNLDSISDESISKFIEVLLDLISCPTIKTFLLKYTDCRLNQLKKDIVELSAFDVVYMLYHNKPDVDVVLQQRVETMPDIDTKLLHDIKEGMLEQYTQLNVSVERDPTDDDFELENPYTNPISEIDSFDGIESLVEAAQGVGIENSIDKVSERVIPVQSKKRQKRKKRKRRHWQNKESTNKADNTEVVDRDDITIGKEDPTHNLTHSLQESSESESNFAKRMSNETDQLDGIPKFVKVKLKKTSRTKFPVFSFTRRHLKNVHSHYLDILQKCLMCDAVDTYSMDMSKDKQVELEFAFSKGMLKEGTCQKNIFAKFEENSVLDVANQWQTLQSISDLLQLNNILISVAYVTEGKTLINKYSKMLQKRPNCILVLVDLTENLSENFDDVIDNQRTFLCKTSAETIFRDIDLLLERFAFGLLRPKVSTLKYLIETQPNWLQPSQREGEIQYLDTLKTVHGLGVLGGPNGADLGKHIRRVKRNKKGIHELLSEMKYAYKRSEVPDSERPMFLETKIPDKETITKLLALENVLGCGVRFGTLEISIDENINHEDRKKTKRNIKYVLKDYTGTGYSINYTTKDVELHTCVGAMVGRKDKTVMGTLGAFADVNCVVLNKTNTNDQTQAEAEDVCEEKDNYRCALISKHVAMNLPNNELHHKGEKLGHIMQPHCEPDIAAARINDGSKCGIHFKTEEGDVKACKLFDFQENNDDLPGVDAHIWGAFTQPGKGKITVSEYHSKSYGPHLLLEDREGENNFSQPGDSGSSVCFLEREGEFLRAAGMLVGQFSVQKDMGCVTDSDSECESNSSGENQAEKALTDDNENISNETKLEQGAQIWSGRIIKSSQSIV